MLLKDKIVNTKPREKSGSTSASRFDFQKDWGICKLIEYHQSKSDYLIIFDWHEDLVIMDSEHNPKEISFYQIKGKKSGNWSINDLIKSKDDSDGNALLSIIGKLYDCKLKHDVETTSLNFVSNARFNIGLEDKSSSLAKDNLCILEISKKDIDKITAKLKIEHQLTTEPIYESLTFLKVLDLSLNDSEIHTQGKISAFLDALYPGKKFNTPTVYRLLFDEVKRRSNYNKDIITYDELLSNKAIGKTEFDRIIDATGLGKDYDEIWKRAEAILLQGGLNYKKSKILKNSWTQFEIDRMDHNNNYLHRLSNNIKDYCNTEIKKSLYDHLNLFQCVETIFASFDKEDFGLISYSNEYVKAIILSHIYE